MNVGFTGTREGMTQPQREALSRWLRANQDITVIRHGMCVGADEQFSCTVVDCFPEGGLPHEVAYPCTITALQWRDCWADTILSARSPLDRNRDIVDACDVLLAAPKGPEERRSGTWSTVRYARRVGKPVVVFWPDGQVTPVPAARQD